ALLLQQPNEPFHTTTSSRSTRRDCFLTAAGLVTGVVGAAVGASGPAHAGERIVTASSLLAAIPRTGSGAPATNATVPPELAARIEEMASSLEMAGGAGTRNNAVSPRLAGSWRLVLERAGNHEFGVRAASRVRARADIPASGRGGWAVREPRRGIANDRNNRVAVSFRAIVFSLDEVFGRPVSIRKVLIPKLDPDAVATPANDVTYLDDQIRIVRGGDGALFVFRRARGDEDSPMLTDVERERLFLEGARKGRSKLPGSGGDGKDNDDAAADVIVGGRKESLKGQPELESPLSLGPLAIASRKMKDMTSTHYITADEFCPLHRCGNPKDIEPLKKNSRTVPSAVMVAHDDSGSNAFDDLGDASLVVCAHLHPRDLASLGACCRGLRSSVRRCLFRTCGRQLPLTLGASGGSNYLVEFARDCSFASKSDLIDHCVRLTREVNLLHMGAVSFDRAKSRGASDQDQSEEMARRSFGEQDSAVFVSPRSEERSVRVTCTVECSYMARLGGRESTLSWMRYVIDRDACRKTIADKERHEVIKSWIALLTRNTPPGEGDDGDNDVEAGLWRWTCKHRDLYGKGIAGVGVTLSKRRDAAQEAREERRTEEDVRYWNFA
ncbi:hypothetical protein THAOC_08157, partial [Thalassiosira oceanica]